MKTAEPRGKMTRTTGQRILGDHAENRHKQIEESFVCTFYTFISTISTPLLKATAPFFRLLV